jgi:hypothetical protein
MCGVVGVVWCRVAVVSLLFGDDDVVDVGIVAASVFDVVCVCKLAAIRTIAVVVGRGI